MTGATLYETIWDRHGVETCDDGAAIGRCEAGHRAGAPWLFLTREARSALADLKPEGDL